MVLLKIPSQTFLSLLVDPKKFLKRLVLVAQLNMSSTERRCAISAAPDERLLMDDEYMSESEESFLPKVKTSRSERRFSRPLTCINALLLVVNILAASIITLKPSTSMGGSKVEYGPLSRLSPLQSRVTDNLETGPLTDLVTYRDEHWNISLDEHSPFAQPPGEQVDKLWESISTESSNSSSFTRNLSSDRRIANEMNSRYAVAFERGAERDEPVFHPRRGRHWLSGGGRRLP